MKHYYYFYCFVKRGRTVSGKKVYFAMGKKSRGTPTPHFQEHNAAASINNDTPRSPYPKGALSGVVKKRILI